jgi:NADH-quinone oxidoreductase subunit N
VNWTDVLALAPFIIVSAAIVVVMLVTAFHRSHKAAFSLTLIGLAGAFACVPWTARFAPRQVTPLLSLDPYALFFVGLLVLTTFAVAVMSYDYLESRSDVTRPEEYYLLLMLAGLGGMVLVASSHFASFFVGLEILSVSLYGLVAYLRDSARSLEAGVKYLVLAATSASFLLFGMALVYAETGTLAFSSLAASVHHMETAGYPALFLAGVGMIVVGVGFKLAVVPFHLWTPDVYEGAPAPVTAFVATASKGAMVALMLRYFYTSGSLSNTAVFWAFAVIAGASMIVGNFLALFQNNVKRILAYSSIAHLGYILVAFLAGGIMAAPAVTFYLVAYFLTTLGAFSVMTALSGAKREAEEMGDYRGLARRHPWLAGAMTASLFSLAGIPLTAGFVGKFFLVRAGVGSALWVLVLLLVLTSTVGLFYYLRIVVAIYSSPEEKTAGEPAGRSAISLTGAALISALTLLLVWVGVYPGPVMQLVHAAVTRML